MTSPEALTKKTQDSLFTRTESGNVVFYYSETFDRETGEYDEFYGRFSQAEYEQAIRYLIESKRCKITGNNCTAEITDLNGLCEVLFSTPNKTIILKNMPLERFL